MIVGLDHIQLAMPPGDEEKAAAFFVGVLGFTKENKPFPLSERGGQWFAAGPFKLHIGVDKQFNPQKKAHPAFLYDDIEQIAKRLCQAGYPVRWDEDLPERRRFYTEDPFGNRIEIIENGDGFSQKK